MQIGFDPEYRRGKRPHLGEERFGALIDTGADQSFVDPAVADRVLMPQVDWTVLRATVEPVGRACTWHRFTSTFRS